MKKYWVNNGLFHHPSALLAFRCDIVDWLFAIGSAILAFGIRMVLGKTFPSVLHETLATISIAQAYMAMRAFLTYALEFRIADFYRCRFAFLLVCVAGNLFFALSPAVMKMFNGPIENSVCITLATGIVAILFNYLRFGHLPLAFVAYAFTGALCARHPLGTLSLFALVIIFFSVRRCLHKAQLFAMEDSDFGNAYILALIPFCKRIDKLKTYRFACVMAFAIGAACMVWIKWPLDYMEYAMSAKLMLSRQFLIGLAFIGLLFLFNAYFMNRACDVENHVPGCLLFLYAGLLVLALAIPLLPSVIGYDILDTSASAIAIAALLPLSILMSAGVLTVEIGCRLMKPEPGSKRRWKTLASIVFAIVVIASCVAVAQM